MKDRECGIEELSVDEGLSVPVRVEVPVRMGVADGEGDPVALYELQVPWEGLKVRDGLWECDSVWLLDTLWILVFVKVDTVRLSVCSETDAESVGEKDRESVVVGIKVFEAVTEGGDGVSERVGV